MKTSQYVYFWELKYTGGTAGKAVLGSYELPWIKALNSVSIHFTSHNFAFWSGWKVANWHIYHTIPLIAKNPPNVNMEKFLNHTSFHFCKESWRNFVLSNKDQKKDWCCNGAFYPASHSQYNNIPICRAVVQQQVCSVLRLEALAYSFSLVCILRFVVSSASKGQSSPIMQRSHASKH